MSFYFRSEFTERKVHKKGIAFQLCLLWSESAPKGMTAVKPILRLYTVIVKQTCFSSHTCLHYDITPGTIFFGPSSLAKSIVRRGQTPVPGKPLPISFKQGRGALNKCIAILFPQRQIHREGITGPVTGSDSLFNYTHIDWPGCQ